MTDKEISIGVIFSLSLSSFWLLLATTVGLGKILGQSWYKKSGYAIPEVQRIDGFYGLNFFDLL